MSIEAKVNMTPVELARAIDRFISDNRHSRSEVDRWLASHLIPTLTMFGEITSARGVGPELRKLVNEFRAKEIESEMESKRREIDNLERDLKKVRAA